MPHRTRFTPHKALGRLEAQKGRRYNFGDIANIMEDDRQKIRYQLNHSLSEIKTIMIDKWLDFFEHEGMPITVADLFTTDYILTAETGKYKVTGNDAKLTVTSTDTSSGKPESNP